MKQLIAVYKLVWVRLVILTIIPGAALFLSQTETWSGSTWDDKSGFEKWRLLMQCAIASAGALAAFIDQSLGRAGVEMDRRTEVAKRRTDTELIEKP